MIADVDRRSLHGQDLTMWLEQGKSAAYFVEVSADAGSNAGGSGHGRARVSFLVKGMPLPPRSV